ncbi:MAG: replication factor C small subunit [Candidatus Helarchaeota archaeon]|nr:replication factor C small subunit [Candidatus Helarchaeota archaeon]
MWVEKYRPRTLSDVVNQTEIVTRLKIFIQEKSMPHLIFSGPPGTGKTTCALALAHDLFGHSYRQNVKELNASVTSDTPILIKINNEIKRTNFKELAKLYFKDNSGIRVKPEDLKVLSIGLKYEIRFSDVDYIFRHKVQKIAKIRYEGGYVKTSLDHSVIIFNEEGNLISKKVSELLKGDLLISFKTNFLGKTQELNLRPFEPNMNTALLHTRIRNPKVKKIFKDFTLNDEFSKILGIYLAEGCTSLQGNTSGQIIFTFGYPQEKKLAEDVSNFFKNLNLSIYSNKGKSGFDRSRESSIQIRILNTQLTKFFGANFYDGSERKTAHFKRVPLFIFDATTSNRINFLNGYYRGDGCGVWGEVARITSVSKDVLIDSAWLGRISDIETSSFKKEVRLIWPHAKFSYVKSNLLPSFLSHRLIHYAKGNPRYLLRHSLYSKKSKRVSKQIIKNLLETIETEDQVIENIRSLVDSGLYSVKITDIQVEDYNDYVYDVSVPDSQAFWGGTTPVLLHNSDERGIKVVRTSIKQFAHYLGTEDAPFKILVLDEADNMTGDAQQALRRTMESTSRNCRFILICNYSSKIIDPIQSRCSIFRFSPLKNKDILQRLEEISKNEKIDLMEDGKEAILYNSGGDMRRAINILQTTATLKGEIDANTVYKVTGKARPEEIQNLLKIALEGKFLDAIQQIETLLNVYGLSGIDVIGQIHREIIKLKNITELQKINLIEITGEINFRLIEGADEKIQLASLIAKFCRIGMNRK